MRRRVLAAAFATVLALQCAAGGAALADAGADSCRADAMVVVDGSGSMSTTDLARQTPRIALLKQAMARVLPEVQQLRRLGLMVYGEGAYNDCGSIALRLRPMRNAAAPMLRIIREINPRGQTPMTEAVREAADALDYTRREATVVLVTDGEETCGQDPCRAASILKRTSPRLTIHVIGYRASQESYFAARCMADATGGRYMSTSTEEELVGALRASLNCPLVAAHAPRR